MIRRIDGDLVFVGDGRVELRCGAVTYELLVPAADTERLGSTVGTPASFHTLHYLESQGQGATYQPRLIGFASAEERAFFEILTSVKGIGPRKALRALQVPYRTVAEAIVNNDLGLLTSLPEIGRRIAETIVAQLRGKVDRFIEAKPAEDDAGWSPIVRDALAAMTQLGEPGATARDLIEQALREDPQLDSAEQLVAAAFRLKEG